MKKIFCFGDSNTWGHNPKDCSKLERPWPVVLDGLMPDCEIISEGLCGRTTHMDVPGETGKNGWTYFTEKIESKELAGEINLLIIMLGTNDVLKYFDCSPQESAESMGEYIRAWRSAGGGDVLIVSPIHIKECSMSHPLFKDLYTGESAEKSLEFAEEYKKVAERENAYFMDSSLYAEASDLDGIHMEPAEHEKLANAIFDYITQKSL